MFVACCLLLWVVFACRVDVCCLWLPCVVVNGLSCIVVCRCSFAVAVRCCLCAVAAVCSCCCMCMLLIGVVCGVVLFPVLGCCLLLFVCAMLADVCYSVGM